MASSTNRFCVAVLLGVVLSLALGCNKPPPPRFPDPSSPPSNFFPNQIQTLMQDWRAGSISQPCKCALKCFLAGGNWQQYVSCDTANATLCFGYVVGNLLCEHAEQLSQLAQGDWHWMSDNYADNGLRRDFGKFLDEAKGVQGCNC